MLAGAAPPAAEEEPATAAAAPASEDILRPLGAQPPRSSSSVESQPFPGTGQAAGASVDVSQYVSSGQSIFRAMEKPRAAATQLSPQERLAASKRATLAREQGPEVPENKRLMRATIGGAVVAMGVTLVQFFVTKQVPNELVTMHIIKNYQELSGALLYGVLLAVLLGFMLSAMLVKFRRGPFVGLIIGLVMGWAALSNGRWGLIAGGLSGLVVGIFSTKGMRRVLNV
jgi:hypothetical protein